VRRLDVDTQEADGKYKYGKLEKDVATKVCHVLTGREDCSDLCERRSKTFCHVTSV
jgi:hypothetical protein